MRSVSISGAAGACGRPSSTGRRDALTVSLVALAIAAVVLVAVVVRGIGAASVPSGVGTIEVGAGDTLSSIAAEAVPGSPVSEVMDRIVALNGLDGPRLHVGQSLVVPAAGGQ